MNQDNPDWGYIVEQVEGAAEDIEFGEINVVFKVRRGQVVNIENVKSVSRRWIHLRRRGTEEKRSD